MAILFPTSDLWHLTSVSAGLAFLLYSTTDYLIGWSDFVAYVFTEQTFFQTSDFWLPTSISARLALLSDRIIRGIPFLRFLLEQHHLTVSGLLFCFI